MALRQGKGVEANRAAQRGQPSAHSGQPAPTAAEQRPTRALRHRLRPPRRSSAGDPHRSSDQHSPGHPGAPPVSPQERERRCRCRMALARGGVRAVRAGAPVQGAAATARTSPRVGASGRPVRRVGGLSATSSAGSSVVLAIPATRDGPRPGACPPARCGTHGVPFNRHRRCPVSLLPPARPRRPCTPYDRVVRGTSPWASGA